MDNVAVYLYKRTTSDEYDSINYQDICISYLNRTRQKFKATFFVDIAESPLKVKKPEFDRMISLAKNRELNIIITYDMTMVSKGIVDFFNLYNTLKGYNVELISAKDNLDNTTISGRATIGLLSAFGKYKSEEASIITKKNMELNAKHGIFSGGTPPTGYKIKTVINQEKSLKYLELIQSSKEQIYNLFKLTAAGYPLSKISKESGTPEKTITNIIKNPTYVQATIDSKEYLESIGFKTYGELNSKYGFLPYNRRCKKHNKKESNSKEKFVAVSTHEPIVPADLFIAANKKISDRKTEAKPRVSNKSFLAHQIKCKCGSGMFVHSNSSQTNNGKIYFRCSAQKNIKYVIHHGYKPI